MEPGVRKERKCRRRRPTKWRHGMPSLEKISRVALTVIAFCLAVAVANENITLGISPVVREGPQLHAYYNAGHPVKLTCRAEGAPPIRYQWFKDGKEVEGITQHGPTRSILFFKETTKETEGFYQCEAHNDYGTGLSNITYLQHAYLERVVGRQKDLVERKNASVGTKVSLACEQLKYAPSRTCFWETQKHLTSDTGLGLDEDAQVRCSDFIHGSRVKLNDRISMDENCNLAIAHVLLGDDAFYKCYTVNPQINRRVGSGCTKVIVQPNPHEQNLVPSRMFTSESPVVVFEGEDIRLKGFFSGRPTPSVTWWREDGELPVNRTVSRDKLTHQLHIRPARIEDTGYYVCQAKNEAGSSKTVRINVDVAAKPTLIQGPSSRNVSQGSNVIFRCFGRGKPEPVITWLRNNETLTEENKPSHWFMNGSTLRITKAGYEDRATIHCNISNVHATLLYAAYLNVVDPDQMPEVIDGPTADTRRHGGASEQQPSLLWVVFLFIAIVLAAILCLVAWIAYKKKHHQSYVRAGSIRSAHVEAEMQQCPHEGATLQQSRPELTTEGAATLWVTGF